MYRMGKEEIEAAAKVITSKQLFRVGGELKECENFEKEFSKKLDVNYAILISGGGTAALTAAIAACQIGPGDEVLIPGYTWIATASAVLTCGAIPVICEIDETLTIDPEAIKAKITPQTKAIIPVHMAGHPCEMDTICEIAKANNLYVIEDCCQNDGGIYKGKRVGTWGDLGCFSFNYFKIISSGEGGCVVTNNEELFQRAACYTDCGSFYWSDIEFKFPVFVAQQFRANEIQGAIMREQLKRLDGIVDDLKRIRKTVMTELKDVYTFAPSKSDSEDTGVNFVVQFKDEAQSRKFVELTGIGMLGIDHGKHVFTNWTPLQIKAVGHVPAMNPFNFPQNKNLRTEYGAELCPKTLEILKKTVFVAVDPDWTDAQVAEIIDKMKAAAKSL